MIKINGRWKFTPEEKEKLTGKNNHMYGKTHTLEARQRIGDSRKGKSSWNRGIPHEESTKLKISLSKKGKSAWNKGQESSPETKTKITAARRANRERPTMRGDKNPSWKGGRVSLVEKIRTNFKYRLWRSDVYTRDDFTCQECGRRGGKLNAHHTPDSFAFILEINDIRTIEQAKDCEELWNINNGITYCEDCHEIITKEGFK